MIAALTLATTMAVSTPAPRRVQPATLIDDRGALVRLDALRGKVLIVSFFSGGTTSGSCTAIAGKFLYLQRHLPARDYRLMQITRDPVHDSPHRLHAYARDYGADPAVWSFLTGDPRQITALTRALGTPRSRVSELDEPLFVIDRRGHVAGVLSDGDWSPEDALALARKVKD